MIPDSHDLAALARATAAMAAMHAAGSADDSNLANLVQRFFDWCEEHLRCPFPAQHRTLRQFLCALAEAGLAPGSIRNIEQAVRLAHLDAGLPNPGLGGAEGERMSLVLAGISKNYDKPRKQATPLTIADLYEALTYDHRSRTVRRDQTVAVLARHLRVPIPTAERAELLGTDGEDILLVYPPIGRPNAPRAEWPTRVIGRGDGSLADPHHQLVMLVEVLCDEDAGTPIGWLGAAPGTRLVKPGLSRKLNRILQGVGDLGGLDDDQFTVLLHRLDPRSLMRLQMDALVVLLYAGALRGIQARLLRVCHWRHGELPHGVALSVPAVKAQVGEEGFEIDIPFDLGGTGIICPVGIVDRWIAVAGLGPDDLIFLGLKGVGSDPDRIDRDGDPTTAEALIARLGRLSGDLSLSERFTGHSGRRGFATDAANAGVELRAIAARRGHRRIETLQLYIERNAAAVHAAAVAGAVIRTIDEG